MGRNDRYGHDPELDRATWRAMGSLVLAVLGALVGMVVVGLVIEVKLNIGFHVLSWATWRWFLVGAVVIGCLTAVRRWREGAADHVLPAAETLSADEPAAVALARLAVLADQRVPELRVVETRRDRNAFVGRDDAGTDSVYVTRALLESASAAQLDAVLAHELFHVARDDTRWVDFLNRLLGLGGREGRNPSLLRSVRRLMRQRELSADRAASLLTGRPSDLLSAVELCGGSGPVPHSDLRTVNVGFVATRHSSEPTHPSYAERAALLARVAARIGTR